MRPLQRSTDNLGKHLEFQLTNRGILRRQFVIRTGVLPKNRKSLILDRIVNFDVETPFCQSVAKLVHPLAGPAPENRASVSRYHRSADFLNQSLLKRRLIETLHFPPEQHRQFPVIVTEMRSPPVGHTVQMLRTTPIAMNSLSIEPSEGQKPAELLPDSCRRNPKFSTQLRHGRSTQPLNSGEILAVGFIEGGFHEKSA